MGSEAVVDEAFDSHIQAVEKVHRGQPITPSLLVIIVQFKDIKLTRVSMTLTLHDYE